MDIFTALETRRSNKKYDPGKSVDRETITELLRLATLAPSSFNLQHWKVIVVDEPERKKVLHKVAMEQPQVIEASAVLIMVADPTVYQQAGPMFGEWVEKGVINEKLAEAWTQAAMQMYDPPTSRNARDEALRSIGLFAMAFMLAARGKGLATCPMIGFDPAGVRQEFGIPEPLFPAMLITIGHQREELWPRLSRRPLDEIAHWNQW